VFHVDTQLFGFFRPGYYTAVVIAHDHDGFVFELRLKKSFTGCVKIIAINQRYHRSLFDT
jgi:hypothetical protein